MPNVSDVIAAAEKLWPASGAEEWDRPGLIAGTLHSDVTKVLLSVDITSELLDDAIESGCQLVISHHPFLLRGVTSIAQESGKGNVLVKAIRHEIGLFAAHTNADITETGVSASLANSFGLEDVAPLVATSATQGHGRIGKLAQPMKLVEFARLIANVLPATAGGIRVAGNADSLISTVALCGGAGDSFIASAQAAGADVYVTSDLRHHPTQDAIEKSSAENKDFAIVDISHWAAESLWLNIAAEELANAVPGVKFVVSDLRTDPWDFAVTQ